jgi:hypothetical protein
MLYDKINLMVPSYKRTEVFYRFVKSSLDTALKPSALCWTILLHESDKDYDFKIPPNSCVLRENLDEPNLSAYFNKMYNETSFKGESVICSMLGDDMVFETPGWDTRVLAKINEANGIGIVHCEDAFCSHGACPVNLFATRKFINACNDSTTIFMRPEFKRYWIDEIWGRVAELLHCNCFLPDVVIKHNHTSGKVSSDETYNRLQQVGDREMAGGIDIARSAIWPYVDMMVDNFMCSDLVNERKI